jgi:hypothetical protein
MPLIINVGSSRKASKNYNSTGVDLHLTAELPNDVVSQPEQIATAVTDLYELVHRLLDEQINKLTNADTKPGNDSTYRTGGRGKSNGTGSNGSGGNGRGRYQSNTRSNGNGTSVSRGGHNAGGDRTSGGSGGDRPLTQAQQRAITNMVKRLDEDGDAWVHHEFGVDKVADLSVRQASEFIDVLKANIEDQQPVNS